MTDSLVVPQLMLPGQAAAPDGPVDLAAMYLMHHGVPARPGRLRRGRARRWRSPTAGAGRCSPRRFALFASVLHKHHHGEDIALWPLLAERGADPAVLDALEAEHAEHRPAARRRWRRTSGPRRRTGDAATRRPSRRHHRRAARLLGAHLAHEERDGMALVQQHLTQEDWDRLDRGGLLQGLRAPRGAHRRSAG